MSRTGKITTRAFFLFFSLVVGWGIYTRVIVPAGAFSWDEGAHALRGLLIATDLREGDWVGFAYDSYRQVYWPPLHSWLTGVAFLIGGASAISARCVGLATFLVAGAGMYLAGLELEKRRGDVAAFVAATMFLTSPSLVASAAESMLEMPALLFVILTVAAYFRLTNAGSPARGHVLLGLGVAATYFMKSNYGVLLVIVIVTTSLIDSGFRPRRLFTRANAYAALPLLVVFPIWFAYPPKLVDTWRSLVNQPFGVNEPFGAEGFLFYPFAFLRISASVWVVLLLLGAFVAALRFTRDRNIRFLVVLVVLQTLIGQIHHTKVVRHIFPIMPMLFLLTGYVLSVAWGRERKSAIGYWVPRLLTALVLVHSVSLFIGTLRPERHHYDAEIMRHIVEAIPKDESTLVVGSMDMRNPPPPVLDWQLSVEENALASTESGVIVDWEVIQRLLASVHASSTPRWISEPMRRVFSRYERPTTLRTLYVGLPPYASYSRSPRGFSALVNSMSENHPFDRAVVITSLASSARWPQDFTDEGLRTAGLHRTSTQEYADVNVRIDVYRRAP